MKLLLSAVVMLFAFGFYNVTSQFSPYGESDPTGNIIIRIIDDQGEVIHEDNVSFTTDDTLFDLLNTHYRLTWTSVTLGGNESRILLEINDLNTDFQSSFIMILIDGHVYNRHGEKVPVYEQMSSVGIDLIPLIDGNTYIFKHQSINQSSGGQN